MMDAINRLLLLGGTVWWGLRNLNDGEMEFMAVI